MTDLSKTIAPKSDQLNADDLIGDSVMTVKITGVRGCDEADQPIAVHFEGDDGKPYKPCKSMRRVMVNAWGADGKTYAGRSLTLYRDENVQFGGIKVGGIRISHMSHIDKDVTIALTTTRAKRTPYTVKPLRGPQRAAEQHQRPDLAPEPLPAASEAPEPVETPSERDPLLLDIETSTTDERVAWVELLKAVVMRQKTADGGLAVWKAHFIDRIKPLHSVDPELCAELDQWMEARVKRLREAEKAG